MNLYKQVEHKVREILEENNYTDAPINTIDLVSLYDVNVKSVDLYRKCFNIYSFIDYTKNTIYVNNNDSYYRMNFVIACQLARFILNHPKNSYFIMRREPIGRMKRKNDEQSKYFAACLLMPQEVFVKYSKVTSNYELSKIFIVPEDAVRYRKTTLCF